MLVHVKTAVFLVFPGILSQIIANLSVDASY